MPDIQELIKQLDLGYKPRIVVAISARENLPVGFAIQLMRIKAVYGEYIEDILFDFLQPVDLSRNTLFTKFLVDYPYATHIFVLDTDVMITDDIFIRLLAGEKAGRYITSGLLVKKSPPHYPLANTKYGPNTYKPIIGWPKDVTFINVDTIGFGCVLINRRVIQDIPYPFCQSGVAQSEDYSFFEKCISFGYYPCMNVTAQAAHLGQYYYTMGDTQKYIGKEQAVAGSVLNKALADDKKQS